MTCSPKRPSGGWSGQFLLPPVRLDRGAFKGLPLDRFQTDDAALREARIPVAYGICAKQAPAGIRFLPEKNHCFTHLTYLKGGLSRLEEGRPAGRGLSAVDKPINSTVGSRNVFDGS